MHDPVSSVTGFIPSQADRPGPVAGAGQLPRYLRGGRHYAKPLLTDGTRADSAPERDPDTAPQQETLAARYLSADPIDVDGELVYPMYSEQLPTPTSALTMTLLSATPPAGLGSVGIGLSVVDGSIDLDHRHVAGVDIWRDALERGITFDLSAYTADALFALTPVWSSTAGEPQSWSGNYGIVVERTETGRTVLWCSMGEGPPHFADLVIEVRSTPLDPYPQLFMPGSIPSVSTPASPARDTDPLRSGREGPVTPDDGDPDPWAAHYEPAVDEIEIAEIEIEGYPCSFADIVVTQQAGIGSDDAGTPESADSDGGCPEWSPRHTAYPEPTGPDEGYTDRSVPGIGADIAGYDDPLAGPAAALVFPADPAPETYPPAGRHAWVESPELTGLVPVIRDAGLTDYGPEPPRSAGADPEPYPATAELLSGREAIPVPVPDDGDRSLIDTLADDSLAPILPGNESPPADELDPDRLHTLGTAAHAQGDDDQACLLWMRAARAGHLWATYDLGVLHLHRDEPAAAERWWRAAAARRLIPAMANLAVLLEERGAVAEARMWRTQAVAEEVIATATRPSPRETRTASLH